MPVAVAAMATTVFVHPAARLIKTVPAVDAPARVNGHLPRDSLGAGRTAPTDIVLADIHGQLSIQVVADPYNANIATIALSVEGAAPFVLPFRSFQLDAARCTPGAETFDPSIPAVYPGLGAGMHGRDGGSFWFWEDLAEDGAQDRLRWSHAGVSSRAVWTVWLFSAPAPIVQYAQHVLQTYPHHAANLPKWLRDAQPWKDAHLALPPLPPLPNKPAHLKSAPRAVVAPPVPDYRNSLVAVDNETGQILGVLASDIALDVADAELEHTHARAPSATTLTLEEDEAAATPRQSTFLQRPISVADDEDDSIAATQIAPSCRTSTASAAFFSAAGSEYGDADDDIPRAASDANPLSIPHGWRREASAMSDRTSKAETAFEDLGEADAPTRQHLARSALRTSEIRSIEDSVWQHALANGELPVDGAYTHLAAARDPWSADASAIELARHDSPPKRKPKRAPQHAHMQGGSVLVEFLAGSRLGASIIGRRSTPEQPSPGLSFLGLVPMLPAHVLSFFGEGSTYRAALSALIDGASGWVSGWFAPHTPAPAEHDESSAEHWEYAIPDFDPASLASTPRPVYRRKRPPASRPAPPEPAYSVLHIDSTGVGRRAFFQHPH